MDNKNNVYDFFRGRRRVGHRKAGASSATKKPGFRWFHYIQFFLMLGLVSYMMRLCRGP